MGVGPESLTRYDGVEAPAPRKYFDGQTFFARNSMDSARPLTENPDRRERRQDVRASFAPHRRPALELSDGAHPVLDISQRGLRLLHFLPRRPEFGAEVDGTLRFPDARPPLQVQGVVIRVQAADVVIRCQEGVLPMGLIIEELSHGQAR